MPVEPVSTWFLTEPVLRRAGGGEYRLVDVGMRVARQGVVWTVPLGFQTNGASVPAVFWLLVGHPYSPSSLRAAILHDWMCRDPRGHGLSSREVHRVFYEALRADGVGVVRAWLMYAAVAVFGPRFSAGN